VRFEQFNNALAMAKLALYFFENNDFPRILDADEASDRAVWKIGRNPLCEISFNYPYLSREHAAIRCRQIIAGQYVWEILHFGRHPSYRMESDDSSTPLKKGEWTEIDDGDRFFFVDRNCGFLATTNIDETLEQDWEDLGPDTVNETIKAALATPPATPEIDNMWEGIYHTLLSLKDVPTHRLIIYGLLFLAGLALVLLLSAAG